MVDLEHVYLSYTKEYYTLHDINLHIKNGEIATIVGELDSGKSSLLRLIVGFEEPTEGLCLVDGIPSNKVDYKNQVNLGYLPQNGVFIENKSVKYNLEYPLKLRKNIKEKIEIKVNNAITSYELTTMTNMKLRDLSPIDRIKVALARFSLRQVDLFVIDDVFSEITIDESKKVAKYINDLISYNGATAIITTTNESVAKLFKGKVYYMTLGSLGEHNGKQQ